jgi:DNA-binding XRE family transcriptional regulator
MRLAREQAGMTQAELAVVLGIKQPNIARWETGERLPRVDTAVRLAKALGTTVEAIWTEAESAEK